MLTQDKIEPALDKHDIDVIIASTQKHVFYSSGLHPSTTVTPHPENFKETGFYYDSPPSPPKYFSLWSRDAGGPHLVLPPVSATQIIDLDLDLADTFVYAPPGYMLNHVEELTPADQSILSTLETTYDSIYDALTAALEATANGAQTVAFERMSCSPTVSADIEDALAAAGLGDVATPDATEVFHELRLVKTDEEIRRVRAATEANEAAIEAAAERLKVGMTEREFANIFHEELVRRGARPGHTNIGFGEHTAYVHVLPGERTLAEDDLVRFEVGCWYEGYPADLARTFAFGEADPQAADQYRVLTAVLDRAEELMQPGVTTAELHNEAMENARRVAADLGVDELTQWTRRHIGHNMGLDVHDHPIISPQMDHHGNHVLEPGMVINYEVCYATLGRFGVQVEDTALITEDGIEPFSRAPRSVPELEQPGTPLDRPEV